MDMMSATGSSILHALAKFPMPDGMFSGKRLRLILNIPPDKEPAGFECDEKAS
jgi:hypothetical protein